MSRQADRLIRVETVAELTGLSPDTIYAGKAGTNTLLRVRLGRATRFSYLDVLAWIERKKTEAIKQTELHPKVILIGRPQAFTKDQIDRICHRSRKRKMSFRDDSDQESSK